MPISPDDIINGTSKSDVIVDTNGGNDTISSGAGNDVVDSGTGNDRVDGGSGDDLLFGGAGNDAMVGGSGADTIFGGSGNDLIGRLTATGTIDNGDGGGGGDVIFGDGFESYADYLLKGGDTTLLAGATGADVIYGGNGSDLIFGDNGNNLHGSAAGGADTIYAGNGNDRVFGEGGSDLIYGENGDDVLDGGAGNDTMDGGDGKDTMFGGSGNDTLLGANGKDLVYGGSGDDIVGVIGDNNRHGEGYETGGDVMYGDGLEGYGVALAASLGNDTISSGRGNDTIYGDNGNNLSGAGAGGNDLIYAGSGNDIVYGEGGDDRIYGEKGNDKLYGGAGNDEIAGGLGADVLTGGAGQDRFVFSAAIGATSHDDHHGDHCEHEGRDHDDMSTWSDSNTSAMDVITDFKGIRDQGAVPDAANLDKIDLVALLGSADLNWGGSTPTANGVWFVKDVANNATYVYADINGNAGTPELAIKLLGLHDLTNGDFLGVKNAGPVAVVDANSGDAVKESGLQPGGNLAEAGDPSASGNVLSNDTDADFNAVLSVANPGSYVGKYGTLVLNANGSYTYTLDNADADTQALRQTQTVNDEVFSYTVTDGAATSVATLRITIAGTNDAPTVTAALTSASVEGNAAYTLNLLAGASDVDAGEAGSLTVDGVLYSVNGGVASATLPAGVSRAGATLSVDPSSSAFNQLAVGETATIVVSYVVKDVNGASAAQSETLVITGTNDAPLITSGPQSGAVTEDGAPSASGSVSFVDVDLIDLHSASFVAAPGQTSLGTFSLAPVSEAASSANGSVAWGYSLNNAAAQHLAAGQSVSESYAVTVADGHGGTATQTVVITISGTNDAPIAVADAASAVEDNFITGTVATNDSDIDDGAILTYSLNAPVAGLTIATDGSYSFNAGNAAYQHLAAGATATVVGNYTVTDEHGATSVSTLTITVTGTNDAPVAVADTAMAVEDNVITGTVATNDSDVDDGAVLSYALNAPVAGLTIATDGSYSFNAGNAAYQHLAAGATATVVGNYTVTDDHGATSVSTLTITVTGTNDTPVAVADTASAVEDNLITGTVATNDSDVDDGAVLSYALNDPVAGLTIATDGSYSFNAGNAAYQHLAAGVSTTVVGNYTVTDEHGATSISTLTITVTGTNDTPIAVADTVSAVEENVITGTVATNDSDIDDGAILTYSLSAPVAGLIIATDGSYSFNAGNAAYQHLAAGATATVVGNYIVTDEHGATSISTLTITVTGTNDTPVAVADTASAVEDNVITGTVATNDSDVDDGAVLSYALNAPVAGLTIAIDGSYSFNAGNAAYQHLAAGASTNVLANYTVTDEHGASSVSTLTITVTGTNDAPIAVADTASVVEDNVITGTIATNDSDVDDGAILSYSLNAPVAGLSIATDGSYSFNAGNAAYQHLAAGATATVVANYTVTDEHGATSVSTLTITVTGTNDAPVAVADTGAAVEDNVITGTVATNDSDIDDGAVLGYSLNAPVAGLTIAIDGSYSFNAGNAAYQHLAAGATTTVVGNYTVTDEHGATSVSTLTITVTGTNDAPIAVADTDAAVEDSVITGTVATNDSDIDDGAALSYSLNAPVAGLTIATDGSYSFNAGNATYQHLAAGATATVVANYTVTDEHGETSVSTLTITVTGTNDAPVAVADTASVVEDNVITGTVAMNDSDIDDGAALSYALNAPVAGLTIGTGGSYSFNAGNAAYQHLAAGATETVVGNYTVTDEHGATSVSTLTITVTGTNDAPVAVADTGTVAEDSTITGTVATNDTDVDDGAVLSYTLNAPVAGLTIASDGSYSFDAGNAAYQHLAAGATATVLANYTVTDEHGATSVSTLTITVTGTNDAPIAVADSATGNEDTSILTGNVLANDTDVDSALTPGSVTGFSQGAHGSVVNNGDGTFTYLGNADFNGTDSFAYTIRDDQGAVSTATVNVTVAAVNDAPIATIAPASYAATEQVSLSLKNSGLSISDVDAGASVVSVVLAVGEGTLTVSAGTSGATVTNSGTASVSISGTVAQINALLNTDAGSAVSYIDNTDTPSATTTLTLSVNDAGHEGSGGALTGSDSALINIAAVNDAPVNTVPGAQAATEDTVKSIGGLSIADVDAGAAAVTTTLAVARGTLSLASVAGGAAITNNGSASVTLTGTVTAINLTLAAAVNYLGAGNFYGSDTLTMSTSDGGATGAGGVKTDTDTIAISVAGVDDAPVTKNDTAIVSSGTAVTFSTSALLANDTDIDGASLTITAVGSATAGISGLSLSAVNGTISFTSTTGMGSFQYTVSDGLGGTATAIVTVDSRSLGGGADTLDLSALTYQVSYIDGGAGADSLTGGSSGDTLIGGSGNGADTLIGTGGDDVLSGGDGNDVLTGGAGNDILRGGDGNGDSMDGGAGSEDLLDFSDGTAALTSSFIFIQSNVAQTMLNGTAGLGNNDSYVNMEGVIGTSLADTINGSASNDIIRGGAGNDTLDGAGGSDLIDFSDATGGISFTLVQSASPTTFIGTSVGLGTDTYRNFEGVIGTSFADTLTGTASADQLRGGNGADVLNGLGGNDRLVGGNGADVLTGGLGNDTFVFSTAPNAVDSITDFDANGADLIELSKAAFTGLTTAAGSPLSAAEYAAFDGTGASATVGSGVHVIYDSATGNLYYDADGGNNANRSLFLTLTPNGTFDQNDIAVGG